MKLSRSKAIAALELIATNSRRFLDAVNDSGSKNQGLVRGLLSASAGDMESILQRAHGWRSFRAKNVLRIRQPSTRLSDTGRYKKIPNTLLCGSGPRRYVSHRLKTTAWKQGSPGKYTRKVAAIDSQTAGGLQLWSSLLRQIISTRREVYRPMKARLHDAPPPLEKLLFLCEPALIDEYPSQFTFCEESQLLSRHSSWMCAEESESDYEDLQQGAADSN